MSPSCRARETELRHRVRMRDYAGDAALRSAMAVTRSLLVTRSRFSRTARFAASEAARASSAWLNPSPAVAAVRQSMPLVENVDNLNEGSQFIRTDPWNKVLISYFPSDWHGEMVRKYSEFCAPWPVCLRGISLPIPLDRTSYFRPAQGFEKIGVAANGQSICSHVIGRFVIVPWHLLCPYSAMYIEKPSPTGSRRLPSSCAKATGRAARFVNAPSATSPIGPSHTLKACAEYSKGVPSSPRIARPSPSPARCRTAMSPPLLAPLAGSGSTVSSAPTAIAAVTSSLPCWLDASSIPHPSLPPPGRYLPRRLHRASARCARPRRGR